jgi:hypothetical protein
MPAVLQRCRRGMLRIFDLSKNEQRVVLIVIFVLIAVAFIGYERRVDHAPLFERNADMVTKPSPSPVETTND